MRFRLASTTRPGESYPHPNTGTGINQPPATPPPPPTAPPPARIGDARIVPTITGTPRPVAVTPRSSTVPLSEGESFCPTHNVPWVLWRHGVSKGTGVAYGPFFACGVDGPCKEKPTKQWVVAALGMYRSSVEPQP